MNPRALVEAASAGLTDAVARTGLKESNLLTEALGSTPSSMQKLIGSYHEAIPKTLTTPNFLKAETHQIASVIDPERSRSMALALQRSSSAWTSHEHVHLHPRLKDGTQILPTIRITPEPASEGALGTWIDGKIKIGPYASAMTPQKAGIVVHETTHHEQAFLLSCRKADQMGLSCGKFDSQQLGKLREALLPSHLNLSELTVKSFMNFRAGRTLTAEAAERADQLVASRVELWGLPFRGVTLRNQAIQINRYQEILENPASVEKAKAVLAQLQNKEKIEGFNIAKQLSGGGDLRAERELLLARFPSTPAASWTEAEFVKARDAFSDNLAVLQLSNAKLKRIWDRKYTSSLHEREARFNEFIASQSLKSHLDFYAPNSKQWLPVYIQL